MAILASAAKAAARGLLGQFFRMGFGANEAISQIRKLGYGYRRATMLRDYRAISGKMRKQDIVEDLPPDIRPDRRHFVETELRQPERSYRVFGEVQIYDWDEDKYVVKNVSWYDDQLRSKQQWSGEFVRQFGGIYAEYGQAVQSVKITAIEHNVGHPY